MGFPQCGKGVDNRPKATRPVDGAVGQGQEELWSQDDMPAVEIEI